MKKRYVVLTLALVAALSVALPAVGASPANLAKKAFGMAKKANKRAKGSAAKAGAAQSAAGSAKSAAKDAQATADAARAEASAARSTANSAESAAAAAPTSARQVYRDAGQALAPAAGPISVATMSNVEPGAYVIMAKTDVYAGGTGNGVVQCRVTADGDTDFANTYLGDDSTGSLKPVFEATLQTNLVHTFTSTGAIFLRCSTSMPITGTATAQQSKIIAMKVGKITSNDAVGG